MSELVWGIKNGDIDQVKDIVEKNVRHFRNKCHSIFDSSLILVEDTVL